MCHCQPATALRSGQPVLILGIQHEVLPFSPLWLHVRSFFPFAKKKKKKEKEKEKEKKTSFSHFLSSTFSNVPCTWDLHSGLPSIGAGGLYEAHYPSGKVRKILVSMVHLVQNLVRISGRKGRHPSCTLKTPLSVPDKLSRTTLLILSGLPKYHITSHHIRQENSHPRFGIIMMHLPCGETRQI